VRLARAGVRVRQLLARCRGARRADGHAARAADAARAGRARDRRRRAVVDGVEERQQLPPAARAALVRVRARQHERERAAQRGRRARRGVGATICGVDEAHELGREQNAHGRRLGAQRERLGVRARAREQRDLV